MKPCACIARNILTLIFAFVWFVLMTARPAFADSAGVGGLGLSSDDTRWPVWLMNEVTSDSDVIRIVLDSSTSSFLPPWYWANPVISGSSPHGYSSIDGIGTQQLGINFDSDPLQAGEFVFFENIWPNDYGSLLYVPSNAALGATATFYFADQTDWSGAFAFFVPDAGYPLPEALYPLREPTIPTPEPGTFLLAALGIFLVNRRVATSACRHA